MIGAPMLLKLIDHPVSPYAQKIRILLREKGLPFECVTPSFAEGGERMRPGRVGKQKSITIRMKLRLHRRDKPVQIGFAAQFASACASHSSSHLIE